MIIEISTSKEFDDVKINHAFLPYKCSYIKKLSLDADIFKKVEEAEAPRSGFKVVLHGDLWYSNFMFR